MLQLNVSILAQAANSALIALRKLPIFSGRMWPLLLLLASCDSSENKTALQFSDADKKLLLQTAYQAIEDHYTGKKIPEFNNAKWVDRRPVYSIIRYKGKKLGSWYTTTDHLLKTVYSSIQKNIKKNKIDARAYWRELSVHLHIVDDYFPYDGKIYAAGIHGLRVEQDKKRAMYYPSYAIEGNYKISKLKKKLCEKAGLPENCFESSSVEKLMFRSVHLGSFGRGEPAIEFYRGKQMTEILFDKGSVGKSYLKAEKWLTDNLNESGAFNYLYNPSNGKYSDNNNMIRQLMASRFLAELSVDQSGLRSLHQRNLEHIFKHWYSEDGDKGYIFFKNKSKLGAMALMLRTLSYSPFYKKYQKEAQKVSNTILGLMNENGSFEPWYIEPSYDYRKEYLLYFYSGEAILSLLEYYSVVRDPQILKAARKAQDFYLKKYVEQMAENYYPAYVPWHTASLKLLFELTGEKKYAEAVLTLNDELLKIHNQSGEPQDDLLGRFYHPDFSQYGRPHSASDGVYLEGLADAYELARALNRSEKMETYSQAIELAVHNLIQLQYDAGDAYFLQYPERVLGGIRTNVTDNRVRIDNTQHMLDAFLKVKRAFWED